MANLNVVEKVIVLETVEMFQGMSPRQLARIAAIAQEVQFAPGEFVLDPAQHRNGLQVIVEGTAELRHGDETVSKVGSGHVLGMWSIFEDTDPMHIAARALEDIRALQINQDDFFELLSDDVDMTSTMFSSLVKRLRAANQNTAAEVAHG
jgi:CRP/FNR family cyclic AMP-dependent transcriptional regulator